MQKPVHPSENHKYLYSDVSSQMNLLGFSDRVNDIDKLMKYQTQSVRHLSIGGEGFNDTETFEN